MKKSVKKWMIGCLLGCCALLSMIGLTSCSGTIETREFVLSDSFDNISIITETSDVVIVPTAEEQAKVVCQDRRKRTHNVVVQEGTLTVSLEDSRKWYERISTKSTLIRIYLPQKEYGALDIACSTGDVLMTAEYLFSSVKINLSTGDIESFVSTKEAFTVTGSTGNVSIDRASIGTLNVSISTGDMYFTELECAGNVNLKASTGDIVASQVKCAGDMQMNVSTGRIEYTGGACNNFTSIGSTGKLVLAAIEVKEAIAVKRTTGDVSVEDSNSNTLTVTTSTGNISVYSGNYGTMQLGVDTGKTEIADVTCISLTTTGDTGELYMSNVVASGNFTVERTTGDVEFKSCDAAELLVQTSTGDVEGSLLSDKIFICNTSTGHVKVPESVTGGKCKITTSTGDIEITIENN